ncbi:hypothetical protein OTG27_13100 [Peribacillus sp. AS_1]|nr:hypothetical protein [Peribacillus frigoritolerans]MCZ0873116.1 hypothetical protein [Peribacillus sp. AS_2]WHX69464.1 hypothetical protein QNH26_03160 [Peribacillus frigoritolerans]
MQPIMRPIFKTPGRSAVDMVADLAGVFLPLLCIRNRAKRHTSNQTFFYMLFCSQLGNK